MTHGSKSKRQRGSIGASATPSRVIPGLKMAGHLGDERVKIRKLEVLRFPPTAINIYSQVLSKNTRPVFSKHSNTCFKIRIRIPQKVYRNR